MLGSPCEILVALFVVSGVAGPEGAAPPENVCAPGIQIACPCIGGGQGVQRCLPDGSGYGDCECAPAPTEPEPAREPDPAPAPEPDPAPAPVATPTPAQPEGPAPAPGPDPTAADKGGNRGTKTTLIIAGAATLGAGYLVAVLAGAGVGITTAVFRGSAGTDCGDSYAWAFLPLAGPAVMAARWPSYYKIYPDLESAHCSKFEPGIDAVAALSTIAQLSGAALLATGIALPKSKATARLRKARWTIAPMAGPGFAGLTLGGRAF